MAKDFTTRSAEEAKTHEMLDVDNMDAKGIEWSQHRQIVAMVFRACWHASLSVDQINRTGQVLANLIDTPDLSEMLQLMNRKRILRTRVQRGIRLYEVNY
jgi:hypothetical protein